MEPTLTTQAVERILLQAETATSRESLPSCIQKLRERFADPSVNVSLKGLTKTMQVSLTDLGEDYIFIIQDGKLSALEKKSIVADVTVTVSSSLMERILDKASNPILAYLTGKLKMKGTRDDLLRLQKLMG